MELKVTEEHVLLAKLAGACEEGIPKIGMRVDAIPQENLVWFADNYPYDSWVKAAIGFVEVALISRSGSGYGCGLKAL